MCKYPTTDIDPRCGEVISSPEIWNSKDGIISQVMCFHSMIDLGHGFKRIMDKKS